jgi:hypothetical protein
MHTARYGSASRHRGGVPTFVVVVLTAIACLAVGSLSGYAVAAGYLASGKAEKAHAAMMANLVPATSQQVDALKKRAATSNNAMNIMAANRVYIAKPNSAVTLAPTKEPMLIVLPAGTRWAGGAQGAILLLRTQGTTPDQLKTGQPFPDVWCAADLMGLSYRQCSNPYANEPASAGEMTKDMRRPTVAELKQWLGKEFGTDSVNDYWVATRDFRAAPDYESSGTKPRTVGIFLLDGARVQGGQLGFTFIQRVTDGVVGPWIMDNMCHQNVTPVTLTPENSRVKKATPNTLHPASFAPVTAIERVSNCL